MSCLKSLFSVLGGGLRPWRRGAAYGCVAVRAKALIATHQFRWAGHVRRMEKDRFLRIVLYSEQKRGKRSQGELKLQFKDSMKRNMKKRRSPTWQMGGNCGWSGQVAWHAEESDVGHWGRAQARILESARTKALCCDQWWVSLFYLQAELQVPSGTVGPHESLSEKALNLIMDSQGRPYILSFQWQRKCHYTFGYTLLNKPVVTDLLNGETITKSGVLT